VVRPPEPPTCLSFPAERKVRESRSSNGNSFWTGYQKCTGHGRRAQYALIKYLRHLRSAGRRNREKRSWSWSPSVCSSHFFSLPSHALATFFPGSRFFRVVPVSIVMSLREKKVWGGTGREQINAVPFSAFLFFFLFPFSFFSLFSLTLSFFFFLGIRQDKATQGVVMRMRFAMSGLVQLESLLTLSTYRCSGTGKVVLSNISY